MGRPKKTRRGCVGVSFHPTKKMKGEKGETRKGKKCLPKSKKKRIKRKIWVFFPFFAYVFDMKMVIKGTENWFSILDGI